MTIDEAKAKLEAAGPISSRDYVDAAVAVVRELDEDAIPLMSAMDWGWCKAIINAERGMPFGASPFFGEPLFNGKLF